MCSAHAKHVSRLAMSQAGHVRSVARSVLGLCGGGRLEYSVLKAVGPIDSVPARPWSDLEAIGRRRRPTVFVVSRGIATSRGRGGASPPRPRHRIIPSTPLSLRRIQLSIASSHSKTRRRRCIWASLVELPPPVTSPSRLGLLPFSLLLGRGRSCGGSIRHPRNLRFACNFRRRV
jgi:hypothetical protein